ncbi:lipid A deacylase LpxR family protein [Spirosoma sp. SC4-14]|uniref:lipid A deacylase LpxR family protein n=1 Tax=Spirosoma sp. SC4-14 TaxID=3128900 RepID=UPI0030D06BBA
MNRLACLWLALLLCLPAQAQRNRLQLIRISEDNDGLNTQGKISDREYTNGTKIDILYTKNTKPRLLSALLIPIAASANNMYSVGLTHLMYTPTNIKQKSVIRNDRPYTAVLYATHGLTSADSVRKQRLITELGLGVLGRAALGEELQIWVHRQLGFDEPQGWRYQLPTDLLVNYLIQYEKQLFQPSAGLQALGMMSANVGTLSNNINAGLMVRAGLLGNYFTNFERPAGNRSPSYRKRQLYAFMRPTLRLLLDDSTLQGGFFTRSRAYYVLNNKLLNRSVAQLEVGAVLTRNRLGLSVSEKFISPTFKGVPSQEVGNITLFFGL